MATGTAMSTTCPVFDGAAAPAPDTAPASTDFYAELAAAMDTDPATDDLGEPPLFAAAPHWEPWREDRVFVARQPSPLPRRRARLQATSAIVGGDKTEQAPMPNVAVASGIRRMLAPVAIASTLALAALTHGAVADRTLPTRVPAPIANAVIEAPFSLSGAWRRLPTPSDAEPDGARTAEAATSTRVAELHYLPIAIDAICALPLEPAVHVASEADATVAPALPATLAAAVVEAPPAAQPRTGPQDHPASLIGVPLTELMPVEPWFAGQGAQRDTATKPIATSYVPTLGTTIRDGMTAAASTIGKVDGKVTQTLARAPTKPAAKPAPKVDVEPEEPAPAPKAKPSPKPAYVAPAPAKSFSFTAPASRPVDTSMRDAP